MTHVLARQPLVRLRESGQQRRAAKCACPFRKVKGRKRGQLGRGRCPCSAEGEQPLGEAAAKGGRERAEQLNSLGEKIVALL